MRSVSSIISLNIMINIMIIISIISNNNADIFEEYFIKRCKYYRSSHGSNNIVDSPPRRYTKVLWINLQSRVPIQVTDIRIVKFLEM